MDILRAEAFHHRSAARHQFDQTLTGKIFDRFAQRRAGNPELFAKLALMQTRARLKVTLDDHVAQVIDKRIMQGGAPDRSGGAIGATLQCGYFVHVFMPVPLWRAALLNRFSAHCDHEDCQI